MGCGNSKSQASTAPSRASPDPGIAASRSLFVSRPTGASSEHPVPSIRDRWMYLSAELQQDKVTFIYEDRFSYELLVQDPMVLTALINGTLLFADGRTEELKILPDSRTVRVNAPITALAPHPHECNVVLIGTSTGDLWRYPLKAGTNVISLVQTFPAAVIKIEDYTVSLMNGQVIKADILRPVTPSPVLARFVKAKNVKFVAVYEELDKVGFLGRVEPRLKESFLAAAFVVMDERWLNVAVVAAGGAVSRGFDGVEIFEHQGITCVVLDERQIFVGGSRGGLFAGMCTIDQGRLKVTENRRARLAMTQAVHEDAEIKCMHFINELLIVLDAQGGFSVSSVPPGEDSIVVSAKTYIKCFKIVSDEFLYSLSPNSLDKHLLVDMSHVDTVCNFAKPIEAGVVSLHIVDKFAIICTETQILINEQSFAQFPPTQKPTQCELFTLPVQTDRNTEMRKFCAVMFDTRRLHVYAVASDCSSLTQIVNIETLASWILPEALLLVNVHPQGGAVYPLLRSQEPELEQQTLLLAEAVKQWIVQDAEAITDRVKPPPPLVEEIVGNAKEWLKSALDEKDNANDDKAIKATKAILKPLKVGAKGLKLVGEGVISKVTEATTQIMKNVETLTQIQDSADRMEHEAADFARLAKQLESKF